MQLVLISRPIQTLKEMLPLSAVGLEWVVPALVGTGVGLLLSKAGTKIPEAKEMEVNAKMKAS